MKKILQGLVLLTAATTPLLSITLSNRTFIAHRDELAYQAIEWTTNNHYRNTKSETEMGGLLTATPLYSQTINSEELAILFGTGGATGISVSSIPLSGTTDNYGSTFHQELYGFSIDHCPNCDGSSATQKPMSGRLQLSPQRCVEGVYLGWDQSLNNILKGLRVRILAPIINVQAGMRPNDSNSTPSLIPSTDGITGATLKDYFSGNLEKGPAISSHVLQRKLTRGKISNTLVQTFGLADVDLRLDWNCYTNDRFNCTVGGSLQLPTGAAASNEYMFEPQLGARLHVAAGINGLLQLKALEQDGVTVRIDVLGDLKYFFEGTERRIASVYDRTNAVVLPASPYRLIVQNIYSGVQPAANVMSLDHTVKPGFQFDGLIGASTSWDRWTFDIAYNLYWHQEEKVSLKSATSWVDDTYAFAHNHYSMYANALGTFVIGGTSLDGSSNIVHSSRTASWNSGHLDGNSPITKHQNIIGANANPSGSPARATNAQVASATNTVFPGAFFSMKGPIQNDGRSTSALVNRTPSGSTGVDSAGSGTQAVQYTITSAHAVTAAQITHSLVGGVSYRIDARYPIILGLGGLIEVQESNRNSALENIKVWTKIGIQF